MGWTLAYSDLEDTRARAAALVGDAAADALYPRESPIQEPIQPNGSGAPRFDLPPLPPPGGGVGGGGLGHVKVQPLLPSSSS